MRDCATVHYLQPATFDWDWFVAHAWNRKPALFKAGISPDAITLDDLYRALLGWEQRTASWADGHFTGMRFSCNNKTERLSPARLPIPADRTMDRYGQRMHAALGGAPYAIIVSLFHELDPLLWQKLRTFLRPLWHRVGMPSDSSITTMFHGNYEKTPVGVHLDRFSTMLFMRSGHKRMRFWDQVPWTEPVSTKVDYAAHLDTSFHIDLAPGDMLYWPSSYYHVGENLDGNISTSVNVGIPVVALHNQRELVAELLQGSMTPLWPGDQPPATPVPADNDADGMPMPAALRTVIDTLEYRARTDYFQTRAAVLLLQHLTADGFTLSAPVRPEQQHARPHADIRQTNPIYVLRDSPEHITCVTNGHMARFDFSLEQEQAAFARIGVRTHTIHPTPATRTTALQSPGPGYPADGAPPTKPDQTGLDAMFNFLLSARAIQP